jgi:hypothetical protein
MIRVLLVDDDALVRSTADKADSMPSQVTAVRASWPMATPPVQRFG